MYRQKTLLLFQNQNFHLIIKDNLIIFNNSIGDITAVDISSKWINTMATSQLKKALLLMRRIILTTQN